MNKKKIKIEKNIKSKQKKKGFLFKNDDIRFDTTYKSNQVCLGE